MAVSALEVHNFRSLRQLRMTLDPVTVVVGDNGVGKSNLYRAMRMLHAAANGRLAEAYINEGGLQSTLWAGVTKKRGEIQEVRQEIGITFGDFAYTLRSGVPLPRMGTLFGLSPEVKEETLTVKLPGRSRPVPLCTRRGLVVTVRDQLGAQVLHPDPLDLGESVLSQLSDPQQYPELSLARMQLATWRFYHQFRTDLQSPLRQSCLAVRAGQLAHDGENLPAMVQSIKESTDGDALDVIIAKAFPGGQLEIYSVAEGRLALGLHQSGLSRPLAAAELSDGTLRFIAITAALLAPRPPQLVVLNEPETSLNPRLFPALADAIAHAAERAQILVTTHAHELAEAIATRTGAAPCELRLRGGETVLAKSVSVDGGRFVFFTRPDVD